MFSSIFFTKYPDDGFIIKLKHIRVVKCSTIFTGMQDELFLKFGAPIYECT